MQEVWKDIEGYEGLYQISNLGNIKSFHGKRKTSNFYYLKPHISTNGYYQVTLYDSSKNRRKFLVHKLVAYHFIENPNNYPCVNHKDENKLNNNADNLEWCTYAYNNAYGTARIRSSIKKSSHVAQYDINGYWLASYYSASFAAQLTGIPKSSILKCCYNKIDVVSGFKFHFI